MHRSQLGLLQTHVIQTHVRTRPDATAWPRTSTVPVPKAMRGRPVASSKTTVAPLPAKVGLANIAILLIHDRDSRLDIIWAFVHTALSKIEMVDLLGHNVSPGDALSL